MEQDQRFAVMQAFRIGKFRYLVATDVVAQGIDITDISQVINFDIPLEKEIYVHRTVRTGRAVKTGKAITLVTARYTRRMAEIKDYIGFPSIASQRLHSRKFKEIVWILRRHLRFALSKKWIKDNY